VLSLCLASSEGGFSIWFGLLALLGVVVGHLGLNLFDDYFDYRKKRQDYRTAMVHEGFRARISKCTYLTSGQATVGQLLTVACIVCGIALTLGALLFYFRGMPILYLALTAGLLGISYSGPPLRLSYYGLGEAVIAVMFGPLAMTGVYYAASGVFSPLILFVSLPVGLLVCNIVYVHSILDYEPDKKAGKHTLAVLLGNRKFMLVALAVILFFPYLIIAYGAIKYISPYYLLVFLCLPIAIALFSSMIAFVRDPKARPVRKAWMGPMARWEKIVAGGIDWFMLRWYMSRNLLTVFCLIIIIASFLSRI